MKLDREVYNVSKVFEKEMICIRWYNFVVYKNSHPVKLSFLLSLVMIVIIENSKSQY